MATATNNSDTKQPKILVVDDNDEIRKSLSLGLKMNQFLVTTAGSVGEALHLIHEEPFDVLLCDLHMPGAGDGFTVVSAMRHTNPDAVTLVYTGYPALKQAMEAIVLQADDILVKPLPTATLHTIIREKLNSRGKRKVTNTERVAEILDRDALATITTWLARVEREDELACVPLSIEQRMGHLPKFLQELVHRLKVPRHLGTKQVSEAAVEHGKVRHAQGYSVSMIVEESRILQVSIFETLQNNLNTVDFSLLLMDVMAIADEVDSQLKQTISSFMEAAEAMAA